MRVHRISSRTSNNGGNRACSFHQRSRHGQTSERIEARECLLNSCVAPTIGRKTESLEGDREDEPQQALLLRANGELERLGMKLDQQEMTIDSVEGFLVECLPGTDHRKQAQYAMDVLFPDIVNVHSLS